MRIRWRRHSCLPRPDSSGRMRVETSLDHAGKSACATSRGSALLAVLWLSAALAAIAFALSNTVRAEIDRTSTAVDGLRCYYLASAGVQRCALELLWSVQAPSKRPIPQGSTWMDYKFPSGVAHVQIIPETSKLDVNHAPVEDLYRLLIALGIDPGRSQEIAAAIDDWRRPGEGNVFDSYYLSLTPSFQAPHASLQEIEELLAVKGVTPDIFYGTYVPAPEGPAGSGPRLVPRGGLVDCLSVYGAKDRVDANTAPPAVLAAVGLSPEAISVLIERRTRRPFSQDELAGFLQSVGAPGNRLRVEGNSIVTFRATARLVLANGQLSDLKRTVAAQMKYADLGSGPAIHTLRWYDTAWSN